MSQASLRHWFALFYIVLSYNVIADTSLPERKSVVLTSSRHVEGSFSSKDIVISQDDHLCLMVNEFPFEAGRTNTPHFQFSLRKTNPDETEIIYTAPFDPDRKEIIKHLSRPVFSPDDSKIAWSTIRDLIYKGKNEISEFKEWQQNVEAKFLNERGSDLHILNLENGTVESYHLDLEAHQLVWAKDGSIYSQGVFRQNDPNSGFQSIYRHRLQLDGVQSELVYQLDESFAEISLLGSSPEAVYFTLWKSASVLITNNSFNVGGSTVSTRWAVYTINTLSPEASEPTLQKEFILYKDSNIDRVIASCISPNGRFIACRAESDEEGNIERVAIYDTVSDSLVILEEERIWPLQWSGDGGKLYVWTLADPESEMLYPKRLWSIETTELVSN
jgi:hypothetical protein